MVVYADAVEKCIFIISETNKNFKRSNTDDQAVAVAAAANTEAGNKFLHFFF